MPKSNEKTTISYIESKVYVATNKASSEIHIKLRHLCAESAMKGTLQSGIYVQSAVNLVFLTITESCKNFLNIIEDLQNKRNITYSKKSLNIFSDLIKTRYQGLVESAIRNNLEKIFVTAKSSSSSSDLQLNLLRQSINGMVDSKIQEIRLHNKIGKKDPGVRESKRTNVIAVLTLIATMATLYFSLK
jgi:hypothetical protein